MKSMIITLVVLSAVSITTAEYTATMLSIKECPVQQGKGFDFKIRLNEVGGVKFGSMTISGDQEVNDGYTYTSKFEVLFNGVYVFFAESNGGMCESVERLFKKTYARIRSDIVPPIKEPCLIPPGSYKLDNFEVPKEEITHIIPMKGQFKDTTRIYNEEGDEVVCYEVIVKIDE